MPVPFAKGVARGEGEPASNLGENMAASKQARDSGPQPCANEKGHCRPPGNGLGKSYKMSAEASGRPPPAMRQYTPTPAPTAPFGATFTPTPTPGATPTPTPTPGAMGTAGATGTAGG